MRLEVGKLIRTKQSGLILEIIEDMINGIKSYIGEEEYRVYDSIIDLIEVGDLIVGIDGHIFEVYAVGSDCVYINKLKEFILTNEIESIMTKEYFENNCYKIGDK